MDVRDRYAAYTAALERERYRAHAGMTSREQSRTAISELDARYDDLTSGDARRAVAEERASSTLARTRDDLDRLAAMLADIELAAATRALAFELAARERDGAAAPRALREELFHARGEHRAKRGFASERAQLEARLPELELDRLRTDAERFLEATESQLRSGLAHERQRERVAPGAREDAISRLSHMARFAKVFPSGRMNACLAFATGGMGLDLDRAPGVVLDTAEREGRATEVRCFAPEIPGGIFVSVGLRRHVSAYAGLFAAAGPAFSAAFTSEALPIERRRPYDLALPAAFAKLFSDLLADPAFQEDLPSGKQAEELRGALELRRLLLERRTAGRALFELALAELPAGRDPRRLSDLFAEVLSRATGFVHVQEDYLRDPVGAASATAALRGICLSARLGEHLRDRFGVRYWRVRAAGELLKEIWHTGSTYTAATLAKELGLGPLSTEGLARRR